MKSVMGLLFLACYVCVAHADYTLMVNEFRGGKERLRWQPLADYLSQQIGEKVNIRLSKPSFMIKRSAMADFFLANPVITLKVMDHYGFQPIAMLNHKQSGHTLSGLIIVGADSEITALSQIKGKRVAVVNKKNAAGGFIFQAYELLKAGFDPTQDFKSFQEIQNQNAIIFRVMKGQFDVGFVRTGQLQRYAQEQGLAALKLRVINQKGGDNRSTELFPHWAFSAKESVSKAVVAKVKKALMAMTADTPASQQANIRGFVELGDYNKLRRIMRQLKVYDVQ